jgi:hypothetical protein
MNTKLTPNEHQMDNKRTPNGHRPDGEQTPNGHRTETERRWNSHEKEYAVGNRVKDLDSKELIFITIFKWWCKQERKRNQGRNPSFCIEPQTWSWCRSDGGWHLGLLQKSWNLVNYLIQSFEQGLKSSDAWAKTRTLSKAWGKKKDDGTNWIQGEALSRTFYRCLVSYLITDEIFVYWDGKCWLIDKIALRILP